jgi:hypothetical protein
MEGHGMSERLLNEFPDREPVWGWVNDSVENMELQIKLASEGGVDFFSFCWYYPEVEEKKYTA